ncbi:carboxymuconolactone decarboxylase family protein [Undibacter mobilis]|uniref:Carboxymuconolactone decarboxylase family protein n=2 Tax=Undibacter mobilis TaxID=2292256 RepID=A0A371B4B5_9BRAD|nr:carboxymuconolactone decarboxylase family protein [Undibacter mobilis]
MNEAQHTLLRAMRSGPRGAALKPQGPFAVWLHAPEYGQLAQALGGFCRYQSSVPARLSEFAILCTARLWRAQFEWYVHASIAEKEGVKPTTIADLRAGRAPKSAAKDERAVYDFVQEVYKAKRVSERTYQRVLAVLGEKGVVELVGILGYYASVAMTLNVFAMLPPEDAPLAFAEPQ